LFEVWTWRQLGYHDKPIGLLNAGGYYDGLVEFLRNCVATGFMNEGQMNLLRIGSDAAPLLADLVQAAGLTGSPRLQHI
nr:LOG family protein [Rhodoferax sp.]